jgi:hypothetical protein
MLTPPMSERRSIIIRIIRMRSIVFKERMGRRMLFAKFLSFPVPFPGGDEGLSAAKLHDGRIQRRAKPWLSLV